MYLKIIYQTWITNIFSRLKGFLAWFLTANQQIRWLDINMKAKFQLKSCWSKRLTFKIRLKLVSTRSRTTIQKCQWNQSTKRISQLKNIFVICTKTFIQYQRHHCCQGCRKIDNWGCNVHIFVFCTINFFWNRNLDFKFNCFYSLWTRIYECCPPPHQLSIFRHYKTDQVCCLKDGTDDVVSTASTTTSNPLPTLYCYDISGSNDRGG